jgi:ATP-dependent protease ClpP protease subunit
MTGDIFIYGGIGSEAGEVSFKNVQAQISQNKDAEELIVHIISPGGDVFEGYSIYNALKNTGKKITTHIEGTCASIATLVAGAGSSIKMNRTAQFMIHNPQVQNLSGVADSKKLRNVADQLDQIKTLLIDVYDRRTDLGKEKLWELYDNETWLTADQAEKMGFIDESVDAIKAVARIDLQKIQTEMKETTLVNGIITRIKNLLKFKNEYTETLQDGTIVVIMSEDGNFTGKGILYEDGSPVPAGEHTLASGKTLVVDGNSTITEVKEAVVENNEDMEKDKEIENLKAQLAEATARAEKAVADAATATKEIATAKAETTKFQNKVTEIEKQFIALQTELKKTIGDNTEPPKGPVFKNTENPAKDYDPMGVDAMRILQGRNRI